jgi:inosine-uridine nucleoside N-ribohydrolase
MRKRLSVVASILSLAFSLSFGSSQQENVGSIPIVIDADTANEIDDLYAIVRALLEPRFEVLALNSTQWNHRLSPADSVLKSQKLNEDILRLMNRTGIPAPLGSEMIMGKPWGGTEPRDSAAAQAIIREARRMTDGQKLTILTLGAMTNLASALRLAPDIVPKVAVYSMGSRFDPESEVWNKNEFNIRRDLNAADYVFDQDGLELHIGPATVVYDLQFDQSETLRRLQGRGGIWDYLAARWLSHSPGAQKWIMWDLAVVEALARPELAQERRVSTPPENKQRKISVYAKIDAAGMQEDFWAVIEKAMLRN